MAGIKAVCVEVAGNSADLQTQIQAALTGLSVTAGTTPTIAVAGMLPRLMIVIVYSEAA